MASGSSGKLAITTFATNPNNKLAVVDVYTDSNSGVQNSYQDTYRSSNSSLQSFALLGKTSLGSLGLSSLAANPLSAINSILNGLASGNLNSLFALTGGSANPIKMVSDLINQSNYNSLTNSFSNTKAAGNSLVGGANNNAILTTLQNNVPLTTQIKQAIGAVGSIDRTTSSLQSSISTASAALSIDQSSVNTVYYGTTNKANNIASPSNFDTAVSSDQTDKLISNLSQVNPQISSSISQLPADTQAALVRGFSTDSASTGLLVNNGSTVTKTSNQVSSYVLKPINDIIKSFSTATPVTNGTTNSSSPSNTTTSNSSSTDVLSSNSQDALVQDPSAIAMVISGVTNIANASGLKDTFSTISKNITNNDILVSAAKPLINRAIEQGDLDIISDIAKSQIVGDVKSFAPEVISSVCYNAKRVDGMSQQEFADYYDAIKTAFNAIDPNWMLYFAISGNILVKGCCIKNNAFLCDLIQAKLNELNNSKITSSNKQNTQSSIVSQDKLTQLQTATEDANSFVSTIEKTLDNLNKDSYNQLIADGDSKIVVNIPDTTATTTTTTVAPTSTTTTTIAPITTLDYSEEPFILLASVFVDNEIPSEIQRYFPELNERFKIMGTYNR